ncbi:putative Zn(2)-C6 fungal-type domain-containing protein [Seiridium unicorne]|uniref:Zn(2)-C6 fungal-type domain-containing protein n=1 Tax=Seiridium unicorne TaxID=138068 RepID=A0ABR2UJ63_9PEZI
MATMSNGAPLQPKTIRFVNNQGQPPQKRRRINAACLTCRRRKTRCAGEQPQCSTCVKNGHKCLGYTDVPDRKRDSISGVSPDDVLADHQDLEYVGDEVNGDQSPWKHNKSGIKRRDTEDSAASSHRLSDSPHTSNLSSVRLKSETIEWEDQQPLAQPGSGKLARRPTDPRNSSVSTQDGRSPSIRSPILHHSHNHSESYRVPYFRYFGPTAIVPGFKQMVVKVHDRRRSSMSATSPASGTSFPSLKSIHSEHDYEHLDDVPFYDPHDSGPVHALILELVEVFFCHLGCNYPFLREDRFLRLVREKRVEPILVDAVCALAARFSDSPILNKPNGRKPSKADNGVFFAQRAKAATVDTFPCPSVAAVQACLLMAYEGFGADQDSALWMYLGLAIRMAVDLGLHKTDGVKYQGEKDAWYTRAYNRKASVQDIDIILSKPSDEDTLSLQEQKELEQERIDTLWAVFMLDRVISSGTGRPVTLRDDDFELELPKTPRGSDDSMPDPFPALIQIIHLYGRVSDVLNEVVKPNDLTDERMNKLLVLEHELTRLHQKQHANLRFDASHFQAYVQKSQGTTFILLHLWFHAMIIVLHQPALLAPLIQFDQGRELGSQSREISMSSAKTIADILAFANLIDAKSFIGNPFTSQPIYIAACAFLVESEKTNASQPVSRAASPPAERGVWAVPRPLGLKDGSTGEVRSSRRHFLLASAANQNYQACYKALQHMHTYWGGIRYILTALDQKSEGIWDCETYTREEYESARLPRRSSSLQRFITKAEQCASPTPQPVPPPLAWSLTGMTNTPNPSLTLLFPPNSSSAPGGPPALPTQPPPSAPTPPGNMIYDPIRQSLPETSQMYPPAYPQPNTSALRHSMTHHRPRRLSGASASNQSRSLLRFDGMTPDDASKTPTTPDSSKFQIAPPLQPPAPVLASNPYTPSSHPSSGYEPSNYQTGASPASPMTDLNVAQSHNGTGTNSSSTSVANYSSDMAPSNFAQSGLATSGYTYLESTGQGLDLLTLDNQTDFGQALTSFGSAEMISWFGDYMPNDVLDLYDGVGTSMGQSGQ